MELIRTIFWTIILLALCMPANGTGLLANVATTDITPPAEMKYALGGYGERMSQPAEGIHDPIYAKALVLKKDTLKYALVTLDLLGLPSNVKMDLVSRISAHGWNMDNIMLLPSHSHGSLEMAALNSRNLLNIPQIGIYQPELLAFFMDKLEALILEADRDHQPVKVGTKSRMIDGLNRNRRNDPESDEELLVTRIDLVNGKPLAVLVNWTAHPTITGSRDMLLSAEWPGFLQKELQDLIGNGVTVMYFNGAVGDQSVVLKEPGTSYERLRLYGRKIAPLAFDLYREIIPSANVALAYNYSRVSLPRQTAHPQFMKTVGDEYGMDENSVKVVMKTLFPESTATGALQLGDLLIVGVPGEMTAPLGLMVKRRLKESGASYVAIGGLADEWISYILTRDQYARGGYESSVSFYGDSLGEIISGAMIQTALPLAKGSKQIKDQDAQSVKPK